MRIPDFLPAGGRIGLIAPSFGCPRDPYYTKLRRSIERFHALGYRTVPGPNCWAEDGIGKSNTPEKCAAEVNDFFLNDRSDVVFSCGGGETMCEDLPGVEFGAIAKAKPKWFMGYSDNTNLVYTLPVLADTAAVYAPCADSFGAEPFHPALADALGLVTGRKRRFGNYPLWEKEERPDELGPWYCTQPYAQRVVTPKGESEAVFSGRLLGGCLDCLQVLCGTSFDRTDEFCEKYEEDGVLWFLEACDLGPMGIRRALWQLREAGWFRSAKGFLIGRALRYDETQLGLDRLGAVTDVLGGLDVPMVLDADLGHLPPMLPIAAGALGRVRASGNALELEELL